jgi:diguanylate cyclase (GGDEF)-like protein
MVRGLLAASLLGLVAALGPATAGAAGTALAVEVLAAPPPEATATTVAGGAFDASFEPLTDRAARAATGAAWLRFHALERFAPAGVPALIVRKARGSDLQLFVGAAGAPLPLAKAAELPEFRGMEELVFLLPERLAAGQSVYAHVEGNGRSLSELKVSGATLDEVLARGAAHARMIALAFGALFAMSLAALLIWLVLADRLFLLYAGLFSLQALYVAYLSGQGFDWPVLAYARPLASHAWNVPAALSGAVACLFVREIADLQRFSPRVYAAFRWLAVAFVLLAVANVAKRFGFSGLVSALGNVMFLGTAVFTIAVSFLAWRRGVRAAGWFVIAWTLLEAFTIATAARLLVADTENAEQLLYFGLPLSMVAAAVLIALGVADRLREQRRALTDAERRARTDALTGVLNRRSILERLDAACLRARARNLPISLLFIDLDHFKDINDAYGHPAGDACLRAIVEPIQAELRQSDVVGRYGGEEFVVILSSADTTAAQPIAERIRERVAGVSVEGFGAQIRLTCSIGVAGSDALGLWGEQLLARADAAVYVAKSAGRNRVQLADANA